ncbi:MAG: hypothetical protein ABI824_09440 [Acidobacteriota bacterium]
MKRELTNQELLDRYVHSVKTMLPPEKASDIAAEIRSNLQSLMDDQAMQLGRDLSTAEVSTILKQHGHPVLVAKRYHEEPRPALIGPELFPFYWFTLRSVLGLVFTILAIIAVFKVIQEPDPVGFLLQFSRNILLAEFVIAGVITLGFAVCEHIEFKFKVSERWKPESLPPVPPPIRQPRVKPPPPVLRMIGGVVWLIFLCTPLTALFSPWFWGGKGVFVPSAALYAMRMPFFLLAVLWISQSWLNFTRFAAAEWRPFLRIALNLGGLAWAAFLLRSGDLLVPGPNWNPAHGPSLDSVNRMFAGFLVISCISSTLQLVFELRRFVGLGTHDQPANSAF